MKISILQYDIIWEDVNANLAQIDRLFSKLDTETEIVILPEMFSTGFTMHPENLENPVGQKSFEWMQEKAKDTGKIIVGSILTEQNQKYYNRMYWMRPDGSFEYYDKKHLFHQGGEDKVMTAGNRKVVVAYRGRKFLLQICYDLRFPCFARNRFENGVFMYDAIIYIANWPQVRRQAYMNLLQARAVENQSIVIWANRIGVDNKEIMHSGDSQILDAKGNRLAIADANDKILTYKLNFKDLDEFREDFKVSLDWDS